jgi:monovalent cation/hydrogen antiporter
MSAPVLLILGLVPAVALTIVARRFRVPYPIVFILAGTALAFVPGRPPVPIGPEWIFITVLPPLLFSAAWDTDWTMFRANLRPILQLAIGLVLFTTVAVAFLAHHIFPALSFGAAFVLGAIISPPDAVAAEATFQRIAVPRRIVAIIEGEGLLNDATALVIYASAVTAATAVTFSLNGVIRQFVLVAAGGVVLGLLVAWAFEWIVRMLTRYDLTDSLIENLLLITCPYAAYLLGVVAHVSAILAVVIAGITISRRSSVLYGPQTRLIAYNVWSIWIYLVNAYLFLAIGLQLRAFFAKGDHLFPLIPHALAISALVIAIRFVWIYPTAWLARLIPAIRRRDPIPPAGWLAALSWTGMRGIISLAAALALPENFPDRDVILFVTFIVIFVTLVGQGLTLTPVLRLFHVYEDEDADRREAEIRIRALQAGLERINQLNLEAHGQHARQDLHALRIEYERRIDHLRREIEVDSPALREEDIMHNYQEIEALHAERDAIMTLRDSGEIPDDIFRRIQYDLDLAESRVR